MVSNGRNGFRRFRNSFTAQQAARSGAAHDPARDRACALISAAAHSSCACSHGGCAQRSISAGRRGARHPETHTPISVCASRGSESLALSFWFQHRRSAQRIAAHRSGDELAGTRTAVAGGYSGPRSACGHRRRSFFSAFSGRWKLSGGHASLLGGPTDSNGEQQKMKLQPNLAKWLVVLGVLHGIVFCAGFFAPYDPVEQDRKSPYLPPMHFHVLDALGHFHVQPFVYSLKLRECSFDES